MEIKEMNIDELEARQNAILEETKEESADLEALNSEMDEINERKLELKKLAEDEAEERKQAIEDGEVIKDFEETEKITMDVKEIRNSNEYKRAFGEYLKNNTELEKVSAEARALLTENAENGTIAVPVGVQDKINTAWENDQIMGRITKSFFKGVLKVGVETAADGAVIHTEGGAAVTPENLTINYIDLIPQMIKKVVEVSDEALATNDALVDYLYDEIQYQIVKKAAGEVVSKMVASSSTASYTMAGATPSTADIVGATGLLGGEAVDPVVITTRATAAAIKSSALSANYGYDPFDGMDVIYTDEASLNGAAFVVADLTGVQANFPEGDDAKFKFDDATKADEDIVRIVGRLYAAIAVVATGKVVKGVANA